jgi:predicted Fe-Mo cluster-binding NifX family protein
MLAIPVFRSRVAPVLNWCSRVLLFPEGAPDIASYEEVTLPGGADPFERLRILQRKGVTTLVCGALSPDLLHYAEDLEVDVICGVAGSISDVIEAYREHKLDQSRSLLPGCRCGRRSGGMEGNSTMPGRTGRGSGQGQGKKGAQGGQGRMGGRSAGPGGECICPRCGTVAPHKRGTPCIQVVCPGCGHQMSRK